MPNVGEKSPPDNWLDLHAQSLDALVRGSAPARPYQPYPGDHPCAVCGSLLAFVAVGWPHHPQWFCRKHLEEFTCQTHQPTQSKSLPPSVGRAAISGEKVTLREPTQLTFFNNGPSTTGS